VAALLVFVLAAKFDTTGRQPIDSQVRCLAFSPDSKLLAAGCNDGTARILDVTQGREIAKLSGHTKPIGTVAFSPDSLTLASGSEDNTVRLWDFRRSREISKIVFDAGVRWVAFSPNGKWLATRSNVTNVWDIATLEIRLSTAGYGAFSSDGKAFARKYGPFIEAWRLPSGQPVTEIKDRFHWEEEPYLADGVWKFMAGHGWAGSRVELWDPVAREGRFLGWHSTGGQFVGISSSAVSANGALAATAGGDGSVRMWDLEHALKHSTTNRKEAVEGSNESTGVAPGVRTVTIQEAPSPVVSAMAFSRDSLLLAGASANGTIQLWDMKSYKSLDTLPRAKSVKSLPAVSVLASASAVWFGLRFGSRTGTGKTRDAARTQSSLVQPIQGP
jgi:WD40 repeat protein